VGLDGEFEVKVVLSPNNDSGERKEYQANNTTLSIGNYTMKKVLYLTNYAKITETDKASRYTYYIERSGSRAEQMTFPVNLTGGDPRLSISVNEATIAKGSSSAYIHLNIAGNTTLEGDVDFAIALPAANGYQAVESRGRLIDNELPAIELTPSKSLLEEGELFTITLTITRAVSEDLKVKLTCQKPALFKMPSSVTVPAGETSVTFDVTALDDDIVNEINAVDFTAYDVTSLGDYSWMVDQGKTDPNGVPAICSIKVVFGSSLGIKDWYSAEGGDNWYLSAGTYSIVLSEGAVTVTAK
jgi:hypothetical protein